MNRWNRWLLMGMLLILASCDRPVASEAISAAPVLVGTATTPIATKPIPPTYNAATTPTPDPTRVVDTRQTELYIVQQGDTVAAIAAEYNTTADEIGQVNGLSDVSKIKIGEPLNVPIHLDRVGPSTKLIPDSELVYGPSTVDFDLSAFVDKSKGYLRAYTEPINGQPMTGVQIVQMIAQEYSVNPRLLLAVLEYRGGWVTNRTPDASALAHPISNNAYAGADLYEQLSWAANQMNDGYYGWKGRAMQTVRFADFTRARIGSGLNAGTVAVQTMLALDRSFEDWQTEVGPKGFIATYRKLFGEPFSYAVEVVPPEVTQPILTLPWAAGETWYYTGGPHGGWASGSGWAAIDFTPPDASNCYQSDHWVVAAAPGLVVRSENGEVMFSLDDSGHEQVGWAILYMHMAAEDRVAAGTKLNTGDKIGHPSCEGGAADATHLHLARRYNGEWIPAAGSVPMVLDGWRVTGEATDYDGGLIKGNQVRVACECREDAKNGLSR